ncbi:hypothetical protein ECANGB1_2676 [Enterospora canceri]|uniref:Secreted protein n=1 Tax=Enterospora canceri TaxID=1081671 RepID=A0A1Y1S4M1_9MICR|nr:hypothetical protein ECANGB1_2676 [Enterospora canceri]
MSISLHTLWLRLLCPVFSSTPRAIPIFLKSDTSRPTTNATRKKASFDRANETSMNLNTSSFSGGTDRSGSTRSISLLM